MLKHILMIDDDPDDVAFFMDAIADLSPDTLVIHAADGEKSIEFLLRCRKEELPDVIFMDISMPAVDGWECLREIKRLMTSHHIPIVMFSTLNFKMQSLGPSDVGAAAFLTKSDTMEGLKTNLSQLFKTLFPV
ncbi:MAG TPA: response regulator [Puia sp.]|jgi:CheY-like chemotaxis protein|nr:response regulator [Puia sp.]